MRASAHGRTVRSLSNFVSRNAGFFIASVLSPAKYSTPSARRFLAFAREDEFERYWR